MTKKTSTVELFAGTGSFSNVAKEKGFDTFTVELDQKFNPDLCKDILEVQREDLPKKIDILWCSPPCTTFSVASLRWYWNKGKPKNYKTWHGISMVLKTLDLINEIKKDNPGLIWFIENPRGMLRKQKFMQELNRVTVSYCQYGFDIMKPTDIWTNLTSWTGRLCKPRDKCHQSAPRSTKQGLQNINEKAFAKNKFAYLVKGGGNNSKFRSVIPPALFEEILLDISNKKTNGGKEND